MTSITAASGTRTVGTSTATSGGISDYQTFLKLMTTQLKNQDPTDPMDSSDYAVQLATFSQVEQQVKTNDLLTALSGQLGGSGFSQYANWVGMEVRAATSAAFDGANAITLAPNAASGADQAMLNVYDASGNLVDQKSIPVGTETLDWSGTTNSGTTLPAGNYSFTLDSYSNGSRLSTSAVEVYTKIAEVREGSSGTVLLTASGAEIGTDAVTALRAAQ